MNVPGKQRLTSSPPASPAPRWGGISGGKGREPVRMPPGRMWLWFAIALLANFLITRLLVPGPEAPLVVPYTLFKEQVAKHNVQWIFSRGETLIGRFVAPITYPPAESSAGAPASKQEARSTKRGPPRTSASFTTTLPTFADRDLEKFLIDNKVEISAEAPEEGTRPKSRKIARTKTITINQRIQLRYLMFSRKTLSICYSLGSTAETAEL